MTETMRDRFMKIGEGSVRFVATRDEIMDFIQSEIDRAVEEREKDIIKAIEDYFKGLVLVTDPQKTKESIIKTIRNKEV